VVFVENTPEIRTIDMIAPGKKAIRIRVVKVGFFS
jgi:hypothetical protein